MKILITGITGFVGTNLGKYLEGKDEFELYGMVRDHDQKHEYSFSNVKKLFILEELEQYFDFDVIVHLAGKAHDVKQVADQKEYYDSNELLTKKLFDLFLKHSRPQKFIFISSVSVFSKGSELPFTEEVTPDPNTEYGYTKLNAENYVKNQPLKENKSYAILRPSIIYGPYSKGNLNLLFNMVKSGIPYPLGAYDNNKSFLSVENLCYVIYYLFVSDFRSGIYHIADDDFISTRRVVELIYSVLNKKPKIYSIPKPIVRNLAKMGDRFRILINTERLSKLTQNFIVSNTKIKNELSLELPVKTEEGLLKTFKHYVDNYLS
jgi:nucleoside-diphosphate-sugar epimerase